MLKITATLTGTSPLSWSKRLVSEKETGESHEALDERAWRERMHVTETGEVFIPPMALKHCLRDVAKYLGETVPGKGKATYTKHFQAGILVVEPMLLGIQIEDVDHEIIHVPSDGRTGGGTRVPKRFPFIPVGWTLQAELFVLDPVLIDCPGKIEEYLGHAGKFIGIGRFRPINGGFYGRFEVSDFQTVTVKG